MRGERDYVYMHICCPSLLHYINELCGFYVMQELVLPRALYAYFVCAMNYPDYFAIVELLRGKMINVNEKFNNLNRHY